MKTIPKLALAGLALVASMQVAYADGFYVTAGVGQTSLKNFQSDLDSTLRAGGLRVSDSSVSDGTTITAGLGYQFSDYVAIEGSYLDPGKFKYQATVSGTPLRAEVRATSFNVATLGFFPLNDQFSIYGKIGYSSGGSGSSEVRVASQSFKYDESSGSSLGYGAGVRFKLSDKVSIRGGYDKYSSDLSGFTISTQVRF
jgi:OOP family OmpA-OmpF porin